MANFDVTSTLINSTAASSVNHSDASLASGQNRVAEVTQSLGQKEFLRLMIAQVKNQDPMEPMENGEFLAQMAQFSTVNGITEMSHSLSAMAESYQSGQMLQAASLVGRSVRVAGNSAILESGKSVQGVANLPATVADLELEIVNSAGEKVKEIHLGAQHAGDIQFSWDGTDNNGALMPPGLYEINAYSVVDGKTGALGVEVGMGVASVSAGGGSEGVYLNLQDGTRLPLKSVKQIL